jgi:hypothetical protein
MVVTLEALSFVVFATMVLPRLPQHRVQSVLTICLGSLTFVQHYRYGYDIVCNTLCVWCVMIDVIPSGVQ